jgi:hypothetical protein
MEIKEFFTSRDKRNNIIVAAIVVVAVISAGLLLAMTKASGFFVSSEPEVGTLSGNATQVSDGSASGGKAIQFNSPPAPPPPPPPPPSGGCAAGTHVAGGSDASGGCWPGPNNTGVPAGTSLSTYSGSCTLSTANAVIDAKTINCDLVIRAGNIMIKNSKINGKIWLDTDLAGSNGWYFTLQDSEVNGPLEQIAAVSTGNMTILRSNIYGGQTSVQCEEKSTHCTIQDSYLHGQLIPVGANWHLGGFLSDGGGPIVMRHNFVFCDQQATYGSDGGCTGDINIIPNFATAHDVTIDHNLFGASTSLSYCTYGGEKSSSAYPHGNHIVYTNNVFQRGSNNKCGAYGPVNAFNVNNTGNVWTNNKFADGVDVPPED